VTSPDHIAQMFDNEYEKLQNMIDVTSPKSNLTVHEIIEIYYQVMNVSSMSAMLGENTGSETDSLKDKIHDAEKLISKQFNSILHPQVMNILSDSIAADTKKLQSASPAKKSKDEIESDANLFEDLRQKMSTKEFVEQYDKSLNHD
jgi:hypothetical protein